MRVDALAGICGCILIDLDFVEFPPELARHKKPVALGVIGDAVEDCIPVGASIRPYEITQVEPAVDAARCRIDPRDDVFHPDVGQNLPPERFELVQILNRLPGVRYLKVSRFFKRQGIEESQLRASVAEDEALPVISQPPALRDEVESVHLPERFYVVDESFSLEPGQLDEPGSDGRQPLPEIDGQEPMDLQDAARFKIYFSQARKPIPARALVKESAVVEEPLSESFGIVGVRFDDPDRLQGCLCMPGAAGCDETDSYKGDGDEFRGGLVFHHPILHVLNNEVDVFELAPAEAGDAA
jgi:hypothetical protein